MKYRRLIDSIKLEEGFRALPYLDTEGVWTIGYGFTSINGVKVSHFTPKLTEQQINDCLHEHVFESINIAMNFVNNFCDLTHARQEVLVNMSYQLGNRLLNFTDTRKYIESKDWENASIEMLDSLWYNQTPERAKRMSKLFKKG